MTKLPESKKSDSVLDVEILTKGDLVKKERNQFCHFHPVK